MGDFVNNLRNNNNIGNNNNNRNNTNTNNQNAKKYKDLVRKMKNEFALDGIPFEKIEEALINSNGDFNKAFEYLFK